MPNQPRPRYFGEENEWPVCKYKPCGKKFKRYPRLGRAGDFCDQECWKKWLKSRIPTNWRSLHTYMIGYQQMRGELPLMEEMVAGTAYTNRSSVIYALRRLMGHGLVRVEGGAGEKRRYRAIGKLPPRES
jgi:hypothetical protein